MKNQELFNELLNRQLKNVQMEKKFRYSDIKRLCKYLSTSIFDENVCSLWGGYMTNVNNISKGIYINFYFNGVKMALHRLLYANFVGEISENEYLKFTCVNKGKCCNVNHLKKFSYAKKKEEVTKQETEKSEKVTEIKDIKDIIIPVSFTISFD